MSRLNDNNLKLAHEIIARYPRPKSATIPLCHLAQEQDGYLADDAMTHIGELVGISSAEVKGTASFYEMFKLHPVGKYVINVCTNISCQLLGGEDILEHVEQRLGIVAGATTPDGKFTIEDVECIAACTEAPACQINYRYFHQVTPNELDSVLDAIEQGTRDDIPKHGTLGVVRQHIAPDAVANIGPPETQVEPAWYARRNAEMAPPPEAAK